MKQLAASFMLLLSISAFAEPFQANCYDYWEEGTPEPNLVLKYAIIQDEHGYAEASDCRKNADDCKEIGVLKPDSANTDFRQCLVSKKGRKHFSICHGDYIPSRESSVGTLIPLQITHKGKMTTYLCDEIFLGGE